MRGSDSGSRTVVETRIEVEYEEEYDEDGCKWAVAAQIPDECMSPTQPIQHGALTPPQSLTDASISPIHRE